ncbi:MAG: cytochrome c oxidase subunit 3 [Planctomycetota bacterium]|nr:cytochrome c oxidase subunit 3 [Planctomycetota bacterium]
MFKAGSVFLSTKLGAVNTAVLILSSITMAAAVTMAQRNKRGPLIVLLSLTIAGAVTFLVIKYFEYTHKFDSGIYPGLKFYEKPAGDSHKVSGGLVNDAGGVDLALFEGTGPLAQEVTFADTPQAEPTTVAPAAIGPPGLAQDALEPGDRPVDDGHAEHLTHPLQDPHRPANVHMFFNIYYLMTGLHGVHVAAGIALLTWLLIGAVKGRFSSAYFTPVDLGGLYWHVVDLIWIFLFPLFYLI